MKTLQANIFLVLLAATVTVQSKRQIYTASQGVNQKLEDALFSNSSLLYMMQEVFIQSSLVPHDLVYLNVCVTVEHLHPGNCDNSSLPDGQSNFSYCQKFQWSSSALVNLISIDQLLILDNVITESFVREIMHRDYIDIQLHIDTIPCEATENDITAALMQLLPWVCVCVYTYTYVLMTIYYAYIL